MFYKKRIEKLEAKLELLTKELAENEAIGGEGPWYFGYTPNNNRFIGDWVKSNKIGVARNASKIADLLEYLGVQYTTEEVRLKKKKKK